MPNLTLRAPGGLGTWTNLTPFYWKQMAAWLDTQGMKRNDFASLMLKSLPMGGASNIDTVAPPDWFLRGDKTPPPDLPPTNVGTGRPKIGDIKITAHPPGTDTSVRAYLERVAGGGDPRIGPSIYPQNPIPGDWMNVVNQSLKKAPQTSLPTAQLMATGGQYSPPPSNQSQSAMGTRFTPMPSWWRRFKPA